MTPAATLIDVLRRRSASQPSDRAYTYLERGREDCSLTYGELDRATASLGAQLAEQCAPGDRVLLVFRPGLDYVVALYACWRARLIAIPAHPPRAGRPSSRCLSIIRDARPALALTSPDLLETAQWACAEAVGETQMRWMPASLNTSGDAGWDGPPPGSGSLALLQYTSGSTGSPKGVMLTHANLAHNSEAIRRNFRLSKESVGVIWLPPYHDMGLIGGILQPLFTGFPVYLMSALSILQRPSRWLEAISKFRGTCSGGPDFAYELCVRKVSAEQLEALDLSSWSIAFTGAEPIRKATLDQFAERFAACGFRKTSLHPCYGLAEATLMVTGAEAGKEYATHSVSRADLRSHRTSEPADQDRICEFVGCGKPAEGQNVRIVDPETGMSCADGSVGEVWVSSPSVGHGYWGKPGETNETFGALLNGEGPFLRTGDLGYMLHAELFLTGRIKDLIIIRGENHYPQDLEWTALLSVRTMNLPLSAAFSVSRGGAEELVLVMELDRRSRTPEALEVKKRVVQAIAETHDLRVNHVVLVPYGAIPRTSSGKVQRHLCRSAYLTGNLEAVV